MHTESYPTDEGGSTKDLTEQEKEVFVLIGTGLDNRSLTKELGIAERTVGAMRFVERSWPGCGL